MEEREDQRTPEEAIRDIREKGKPDADEREFLEGEGVRIEPDEEDKTGRPLA
jgi:hypothetical protein